VQVQQPPGHRRRQLRLPARDDPDGAEQLVRRRVLDEEAAGAGPQSVDDVLVHVERGHHQHPDRRSSGQPDDPAGRVDPGQAGHADIHHDDVRPELLGQAHRLFAVTGLGDHGHVRLGVQTGPDRCPHQGLVIGDDHLDGHRAITGPILRHAPRPAGAR
jgi:hypothetical protein